MARRTRPKQQGQPAEEKKSLSYADGRPDETAHVVERYKERPDSPVNRIRSFCVGCMGGYVKEVKNCTAVDCDLYPLRFGVNVFSAKYGKPRPVKRGE